VKLNIFTRVAMSLGPID